MRIKEGVSLASLTPQMALACVVVDSVYRRGGYDAVITSGSDGVHTGSPVQGDSTDPHYLGKALDFRTHDIKGEDLPGILHSLQVCLGEEYVVLGEKDHCHVQYGRVG